MACLLGLKQSGKSTLARSLAPDRAYSDLDDDAFAETAFADPAGFVRRLPDRVTLDEMQRVPEIRRALKVEVEQQSLAGQLFRLGGFRCL